MMTMNATTNSFRNLRRTTLAKSSSRRSRKPIIAQAAKAPKIPNIDYKDVALLRKYISDRGKIRSRRVTGVSVQDQRKLAKAIKNAREMALLPYAGSGR
jgi:small subunit ribosomal protein S18